MCHQRQNRNKGSPSPGFWSGPRKPKTVHSLGKLRLPYTQEVPNSDYKIDKKTLLYLGIAFKDLGFEGGGVGSILFLSSSAKNSEPSGADTTHVFLF